MDSFWESNGTNSEAFILVFVVQHSNLLQLEVSLFQIIISLLSSCCVSEFVWLKLKNLILNNLRRKQNFFDQIGQIFRRILWNSSSLDFVEKCNKSMNLLTVLLAIVAAVNAGKMFHISALWITVMYLWLCHSFNILSCESFVGPKIKVIALNHNCMFWLLHNWHQIECFS